MVIRHAYRVLHYAASRRICTPSSVPQRASSSNILVFLSPLWYTGIVTKRLTPLHLLIS